MFSTAVELTVEHADNFDVLVRAEYNSTTFNNCSGGTSFPGSPVSDKVSGSIAQLFVDNSGILYWYLLCYAMLH